MNLNPPTRIEWDPDSLAPDDLPADPADLSAAMLLRFGRGVWDGFVMVFGDVTDLAAVREYIDAARAPWS